MNNYPQNTPLWHLTVGEFQELIETTINKIIPAEPEQPKIGESEDKYCYSIKELADLLKCSITKAQEVKNSGKIDKAIAQFGRKLIINKQMVLDLLNKKK